MTNMKKYLETKIEYKNKMNLRKILNQKDNITEKENMKKNIRKILYQKESMNK